MERRYLFAAIVSLALIALSFSYFDIVRSFSDRFMWWDSYEHFLGGITVGFAALFALTLFQFPHRPVHVVIAVLFVGLAWEVMESHYGLGGSKYMGYWADTIKDLICDCAGGYAAALMGRTLRNL